MHFKYLSIIKKNSYRFNIIIFVRHILTLKISCHKIKFGLITETSKINFVLI